MLMWISCLRIYCYMQIIYIVRIDWDQIQFFNQDILQNSEIQLRIIKRQLVMQKNSSSLFGVNVTSNQTGLFPSTTTVPVNSQLNQVQQVQVQQINPQGAPSLFGNTRSINRPNPPQLNQIPQQQQPTFAFNQDPPKSSILPSSNNIFGGYPNQLSNQAPSNSYNQVFSNEMPVPTSASYAPVNYRIPPPSNSGFAFRNTTASVPYSNIFFQASYGQNQQEILKTLSFADDQPIIKQALTKATMDIEKSESKMAISLKAQSLKTHYVKNKIIPAVCSIEALGGSRAAADLICVIDISGSMSGNKIELVRNTMKYVVQLLTNKDRLSIILYDQLGHRICPLLLGNEANKSKFNSIIDNIQVHMNNTMINGLEVAAKVLAERREKNQVASIFLLSDGQQPHNTPQRFQQILNRPYNKDIGSFSLHSFGFGSDHDEFLMSKICASKDGNFYYIDKLDTLDQAFCNAFGGVITQAASEVQIEVQSLLENITINKVYGKKWIKFGENRYQIKLSQIMSDVSKDFVFQLSLPENYEFPKQPKITIARATFLAKNNRGQIVAGQSLLELQIVPTSVNLIASSDPTVVEPYYRLKAVEIIEEAIKNPDQKAALSKIEDILETIKYHPSISKQKAKFLIEDLQTAKKNLSTSNDYNNNRKQMVNMAYAHSNNNSFGYSNDCQQQMLGQLKSVKASYQRF